MFQAVLRYDELLRQQPMRIGVKENGYWPAQRL